MIQIDKATGKATVTVAVVDIKKSPVFETRQVFDVKRGAVVRGTFPDKATADQNVEWDEKKDAKGVVISRTALDTVVPRTEERWATDAEIAAWVAAEARKVLDKDVLEQTPVDDARLAQLQAEVAEMTARKARQK